MPTASISCLGGSSLTASLITSMVRAALAAGVGRLTISIIAPFSSTTPAAILVPPTSTPMVRLIPQGLSLGSSAGLTAGGWGRSAAGTAALGPPAAGCGCGEAEPGDSGAGWDGSDAGRGGAVSPRPYDQIASKPASA